jgi:hypothetical protein
MSRELTPEDLEKLKRRIELKCERFLREQLREMRAQAQREAVKSRLSLVRGGKEWPMPKKEQRIWDWFIQLQCQMNDLRELVHTLTCGNPPELFPPSEFDWFRTFKYDYNPESTFLAARKMYRKILDSHWAFRLHLEKYLDETKNPERIRLIKRAQKVALETEEASKNALDTLNRIIAEIEKPEET